MKNNYRKQNGCWNCHHCEMTSDHDEPTSFWCNSDATKRPLSGSVLMDEHIHHLPDLDRHLAYETWDKWCEGRRCDPFGTCDDYKEATP